MPNIITLPKKARIFSDLALPFMANPSTGDIVKLFDVDAIKASVKNLVLTRNFERPFQSDVGSQVKNLLFEPFVPMTGLLLKRSITELITKYEPRVIVNDVQVLDDSDNNILRIGIIFTIANTTQPITLSIVLERSR